MTHDTQPMGMYKITHDNQEPQGEASPLIQRKEQSDPHVSMTLDHVGPTMGGVTTCLMLRTQMGPVVRHAPVGICGSMGGQWESLKKDSRVPAKSRDSGSM